MGGQPFYRKFPVRGKTFLPLRQILDTIFPCRPEAVCIRQLFPDEIQDRFIGYGKPLRKFLFIQIKEGYRDASVRQGLGQNIHASVIPDILLIRPLFCQGGKDPLCLHAQRILVQGDQLLIRNDAVEFIILLHPPQIQSQHQR